MIFRTFCTVLLLSASAHAQSFSPREQQMLMQPSTIGGAPDTFQSSSKPVDKTKPAAKSKASQPAPISFSSELSSGATPSRPAPKLQQGNDMAQRKPFDQRVPFGPLSLGLQAEAGPRSDALVTPEPAGLSQFKKDRQDPYVGVSIIEIKR
jgi:hypothetical protein